MLTVYVVSAIVAGVLLLLSLAGADHGGGHDAHFDHADHLDHGDHEASSHGVWIPFLSLRFYLYFFGGFGGTGLLASTLTNSPAQFTMWLSLGVGLLAGLGASFAVRMLRIAETSSGTGEKDVLGRDAKVLVPIRGKTPGRIRCVAKGEWIDFLAICDDPTPIPIGSTVIIVAIEEGRALVMPRDVLFSDIPLSTTTE